MFWAAILLVVVATSATEFPNYLTEEDFALGRSLPLIPDGMTVEDVWKALEEGEARMPEEHRQLDRNFKSTVKSRWPNGRVPYIITGDFSAEDRGVIAKSMEIISNVSCITFEEGTLDGVFVNITNADSGCFAGVGYSSRGKLNLGTSCVHPSVVVHELLHVLGFHHEQNRPDRDDHVDIFWERIQFNHSYNYFKKEWITTPPSEHLENCFDLYGVNWTVNVGDGPSPDFTHCSTGASVEACGYEYDFKSIMHYGDSFFHVKNVSDPIMIPKNGQKIEPSSTLTQLDINKLNCAYDCDNKGSGQHISGTCGKISSKGISGNYSWFIRTEDKDCSIEIAFSKFSTGGECSSDFIKVTDDSDDRRKLTYSKTYCQGMEPPTYHQSTENVLFIELKRSNEDTEIEAIWQQVCKRPKVPDCCPKFTLSNTNADGDYIYTPGNEKKGHPIYVGPTNITWWFSDRVRIPFPWESSWGSRWHGDFGPEDSVCFSDVTTCDPRILCTGEPTVACTATCDSDPPVAPTGYQMAWNESRDYGTIVTYTDANGAKGYSKCLLDGSWSKPLTPGSCAV